jgi:hypothetical protein
MEGEAPFNSAPYFVGKEFTTGWGLRHHSLWAEILSPRREEPLRILEIGSWEGRSALFFLNYLPHSNLICVDTFAGSIEHRAWPLAQQESQLSAIEKRFDRNLGPFAGRVEKRKADSLLALGELGIEGRLFDLVYIDGSHVAVDVYRDGVLAWPLVACDGIVIFDDYTRVVGPQNDWPQVGIDAFLDKVKDAYEELFRGRQIVIRKHR